MAPQNFNPLSLTLDHVLSDVSQVAITTNNYDSRVALEVRDDETFDSHVSLEEADATGQLR
jgi:hypothetical protein